VFLTLLVDLAKCSLAPWSVKTHQEKEQADFLKRSKEQIIIVKSSIRSINTTLQMCMTRGY
jgi:hypothetical protein